MNRYCLNIKYLRYGVVKLAFVDINLNFECDSTVIILKGR